MQGNGVICMRLAEEYRLSEYRDLGRLEESDKIHIVRNQVDGRICVRKTVALEQWEIYNFLKENPNPVYSKNI